MTRMTGMADFKIKFKTHMVILQLQHFIGQGHVIIWWLHCVIMTMSSYKYAFMGVSESVRMLGVQCNKQIVII